MYHGHWYVRVPGAVIVDDSDPKNETRWREWNWVLLLPFALKKDYSLRPDGTVDPALANNLDQLREASKEWKKEWNRFPRPGEVVWAGE